jgi:predicted AAA+ superfamily ATPase
MIKRKLERPIREALLQSGKIVILYGPRQVGKTTLIKRILKELPLRKLEINADELKYNDILSSRDLRKMKELVGEAELLFIDEAQRITDIGINLKILHDSLPGLKVIATGSSSFDLANRVMEPLTGRTRTFRLFPVSMEELSLQHTPFELKDQLESYLKYGTYPEVIELEGREQKLLHLRELTSSYIYKDILQLSNIKHSDKIHKLLRLLAFQVGSPVSLHELAKPLEMSHSTVNDYIDLLEKGFVLFRLSAFSRNLRKEITKKSKIFFYDLGIRNMLVDNFNSLENRNDIGALWENFLMVERKKKVAYEPAFANTYFWRTYTGAELDYVEETGGELHGYEFKFNPKKKQKAPKTWLETYENATFEKIDRENFLDFVC